MTPGGRDESLPSPSAAPVPLAYSAAAEAHKRDPGDRQFRVTWGALLVLGVGLFIGGLAALIAAGRDQGGYLLILGVGTLAIVITLRRQSRRR